MVAFVKRGPQQIIHRGIDNGEIFFAGALHVFHTGDENAGVTGNEPARLEQHLEPKRLQQRHECGGVFGGGENVFRLLALPPIRIATDEGVLVHDAEAAADADEFNAVLGF